MKAIIRMSTEIFPVARDAYSPNWSVDHFRSPSQGVSWSHIGWAVWRRGSGAFRCLPFPRTPKLASRRLIKVVATERVLAPRMLNVSRTRPKLAR